MEAIASATALGGEIMGQPGELGKVAPGYLADLILVDGNPLSDITILQDPGKLSAIMKGGVFHKEPRRLCVRWLVRAVEQQYLRCARPRELGRDVLPALPAAQLDEGGRLIRCPAVAAQPGCRAAARGTVPE